MKPAWQRRAVARTRPRSRCRRPAGRGQAAQHPRRAARPRRATTRRPGRRRCPRATSATARRTRPRAQSRSGWASERPRPLEVVEVVAPQLAALGLRPVAGRPRPPGSSQEGEAARRRSPRGSGTRRRPCRRRATKPTRASPARLGSDRPRRPAATSGSGTRAQHRPLAPQPHTVAELRRSQVGDRPQRRAPTPGLGACQPDRASAASRGCRARTSGGRSRRSRRAAPMSNALSSASRWSCSALSRGRRRHPLVGPGEARWPGRQRHRHQPGPAPDGRAGCRARSRGRLSGSGPATS